MEIKNLKAQVENCLKEFPDTRNSDITLTIAVWIKYYPAHLDYNNGIYSIKLSHLFDIPHEDNIKRIRCIFQNEKKLYLPTDKKVREKRGIKEEEWRNVLGYNPELREVY
jgi:hypothetical protein